MRRYIPCVAVIAPDELAYDARDRGSRTHSVTTPAAMRPQQNAAPVSTRLIPDRRSGPV